MGARSWKREEEKELRKKGTREGPTLKVTCLGSSSPPTHHKALALGHRVWVTRCVWSVTGNP